jgi:hypothetical protein
MFERISYRFTSWAGRYGDAAPAACCGMCKPCVTTAAVGLVAGAAGLGASAVAERRAEADGDADVAASPEAAQPGTEPAA